MAVLNYPTRIND